MRDREGRREQSTEEIQSECLCVCVCVCVDREKKEEEEEKEKEEGEGEERREIEACIGYPMRASTALTALHSNHI